VFATKEKFTLGWFSSPKLEDLLPSLRWAGLAQLAQDFLFSAFFWPFSGRSADPPSAFARAVSEARLEAEPEKVPLFLFSAVAPPCNLSPALRRLAGPVAFLTLPGFTSNP